MIQTVENCDLGDVEERPDGQAFERRSVRDFHRVFFFRNKFQSPSHGCHDGQNNVLVVYGAIGDSVDLTKNVILKLRIVAGLNIYVGV
jgi:hypothetical protein